MEERTTIQKLIIIVDCAQELGYNVDSLSTADGLEIKSKIEKVFNEYLTKQQ